MKALPWYFGLSGPSPPRLLHLHLHHSSRSGGTAAGSPGGITTHDLEHTLEPDAGGPLKLGTERDDPRAGQPGRELPATPPAVELHGQRLQPRYLGKEVDLETTYAYLGGGWHRGTPKASPC